MTIDQLIAALEEAREMAPRGGDTEVRVAYQPNYPIAGTIQAVSVADPYDLDDEAIEAGVTERELDLDGHDGKLWIGVGSMPYNENPYGPQFAWSANIAGHRGL